MSAFWPQQYECGGSVYPQSAWACEKPGPVKNALAAMLRVARPASAGRGVVAPDERGGERVQRGAQQGRSAESAGMGVHSVVIASVSYQCDGPGTAER